MLEGVETIKQKLKGRTPLNSYNQMEQWQSTISSFMATSLIVWAIFMKMELDSCSFERTFVDVINFLVVTLLWPICMMLILVYLYFVGSSWGRLTQLWVENSKEKTDTKYSFLVCPSTPMWKNQIEHSVAKQRCWKPIFLKIFEILKFFSKIF